MENINKNRIMARFLGSDIYIKDVDGFSKPLSVFNSKELIFDKDWNWIMLVVEKIDYLERSNDDEFFIEKISKVTSLPLFTPIHTVFNNCLEFIKWHNEQQI